MVADTVSVPSLIGRGLSLVLSPCAGLRTGQQRRARGRPGAGPRVVWRMALLCATLLVGFIPAAGAHAVQRMALEGMRPVAEHVLAMGRMHHASLSRAQHHAVSPPPAPVNRYAGWAMTAYPDATQAQMDAAVARQVAAGANLVWIGHDNPGDVGHPAAKKSESGLSYAVYAAYRDPRNQLHADAVAMVDAEFRMLEAIRKAGVKAVLPVGYQIQMGPTPHEVCADPPACTRVSDVWSNGQASSWYGTHPEDVRRFANGHPINNGGWSASFYASAYRQDIVAYYRWVNVTFVQPFSRTIMMINLADEPSGGDYSQAADAAFRSTHGFGLQQAGDNPARLRAVGTFESDYIADYATWSATQWLTIDPAISTTMSFDGGRSRYAYQEPNLQQVFREPPSNFAVTFDAYPLDRDTTTAVSDGDLTALAIFVRTAGAYSARYHRPFYLWSAANDWGLNTASVDPGNISDAVANGLYLAMLAASTGGDLQGIAAWSYDVKHQGLYGDDNRAAHPAYTPDAMFQGVSASFADVRAIMAAPAGRPDTLILAPDGSPETLIGADHAAQVLVNFANRADPVDAGVDPYHWAQLAALARSDVASAAVTGLAGMPLDDVHRVIVLAKQPDELAPSDITALQRVLASGGMVVAADAMAALLAPDGGTVLHTITGTVGGATISASSLRVGAGTLVVVTASAPMETCFSDLAEQEVPGLWELLLGQATNQSGFVISGGGIALLYTIAARGSTVQTTVPPGVTWTAGRSVAANGLIRSTLPDQQPGTRIAVTLAPHEYALYHVQALAGST